MMKDRNSMHRWFVPNAPVAMVSLLAFLILLPFGGLYNIPLLVLCGLGLWCLGTSPREALGDDGLRLLLVVFLCVWLPMAIAAVDAVNPVESWRKVASFPVFFLAGAYVVRAIRHEAELRRLLLGVWVVCMFWSIDASWQFVHGFNVFGFPYPGGRVPGIFHPDLKLGIVLATVSPLVLEATRQLAGRSVWVVLALIPFVAAIVLSGSRSSWIVLFAVVTVYGWYLFRWTAEPGVRGPAVLRVAAVGALACAVFAYTVPQAVGNMHELVVKRAGPVAHLLSGDPQRADGAIKARLAAWESAGRVFRAHWFNGVGPRGFRQVHADYAPASDPYVSHGKALNFPHILVLEIATETGIVGLLGYLFALTVLVRRLLGMSRARQLPHGFPYWLAIVVVLFPLATHLAFYAHFMGALIWWTIAISAAGLGAATRVDRAAHA